ncbi:Fc receptor-like protein 5 isoform 2-T2 [Discoglossus pictus]
MWHICVPLLCALVSVTKGDCPGDTGHTELVTSPGSNIVLPVGFSVRKNPRDPKTCDQITWKKRASGLTTRLVTDRNCTVTYDPGHHYKVSGNGSLEINNVTREDAGNYTVEVYTSTGGKLYCKVFILHVQDPVSRPSLNVSCLTDGSALILCNVLEGTDPTYRWAVNGLNLQGYSSSWWNVTHNQLHITSPGQYNVSCFVRNRVSERQNITGAVSCPAPLSVPVLNISCSEDGSATILCTVQNGTDPQYSWYLDKQPAQGVPTQNGQHLSVPSPASGNINCTVRNPLGDKSNSTTVFCPVAVSVPVLRISCGPDDKAVILCEIQKGTDPSYSWRLNGDLIKDNTTAMCNVSGNNMVVSLPFHGNISCSARNIISDKKSDERSVQCADPLSIPVVNISCHENGSAVILCEIQNGTNTSYTWTVNGAPLNGNVSSQYHVNGNQLFFSSPGPWNVSCTVENLVSKWQSNQTSVTCQAPSCPKDCLKKSILGGIVALIVTCLPLIIGCLWTMPKPGKKAQD